MLPDGSCCIITFSISFIVVSSTVDMSSTRRKSCASVLKRDDWLRYSMIASAIFLARSRVPPLSRQPSSSSSSRSDRPSWRSELLAILRASIMTREPSAGDGPRLPTRPTRLSSGCVGVSICVACGALLSRVSRPLLHRVYTPARSPCGVVLHNASLKSLVEKYPIAD